MLDRIQKLLVARELSASQFADTIGVSRPVVSHLLSGRNKPSLEVVQKILAAFPDLAVNWLLNGDGPMLTLPVASTDAPVPVTAARSAKSSVSAELREGLQPNQGVAAAPATPAVVVVPATPAEVSAPPETHLVSVPMAAQPVEPPPPQQLPKEAMIATALAEPGKLIRRIVLFYQDGTFADFRPETSA